MATVPGDPMAAAGGDDVVRAPGGLPRAPSTSARRHLRTCLLLLAGLAILPAGEAAPEVLRLEQSLRDDLTACLAAQARGGTPRELRLILRRAILYHDSVVNLGMPFSRRDDLVLRLFRAQDRWIRREAVTSSDEIAAQSQLGLDDGARLTFDGTRLAGGVGLTMAWRSQGEEMGPGENSHSMMKAQKRCTPDWNVGGRERVDGYPLAVTLDASVVAGGLGLDLVLDGFAGPEAPPQPPAADDRTPVTWDDVPSTGRQRAPIHLSLELGRDGWVVREAWGWNRAVHTVDPRGLSVRDGRLVGEMTVTLNGDGWLAGTGPLRVAVDAPLVCGTVDSTYRVQGEGTSFEGHLDGSVWTPVRGTYRIESGPDGVWADRVEGGMRDAPQRLADLRGLAAAPVPADQPLAAALAAYQRIDALLLARLRQPGAVDELPRRPLAVLTPLCEDGAERERLIGALGTFAAEAAAATRAGERPRAGRVASPDPEFGPWFGAAPLPAGNLLPGTTGQDGAQVWQHPVGWTCLGPVVLRGRLRDQAAILPEVVPMPGIAVNNPRLRLGQWIDTRLDWSPAEADWPSVRPARSQWDPVWVSPGKMSSYSPHPKEQAYRANEARDRSCLWFAHTVLKSDREVDTFVSLRLNPFGQLWVNGRKVWESGDDHDPWLPVVLPVRLRAGENNLLLRTGEWSIGYHPGAAETAAQFSLLVCTRGRPRPVAVTAPPVPMPRAVFGYAAEGSRDHPDAQPPLAWDLERGTNVLWRVPCAPAAAMPVLCNGGLLVTSEPHLVRCLDRDSGAERWRCALNVLALSADPARRALAGELEALAGLPPAPPAAADGPELPSGVVDDGEAPVDDRRRKAATAAVADSPPAAGPSPALFAALVDLGLVDKGAKTGARFDLGSRAGAVPVVCADRIYVAFGTGIAACLGDDGRILWQVATGLPWNGGSAFSPLLIGDRLVLHAPGPVENVPAPTAANPRAPRRVQQWHLAAFAVTDGRPLWRVSVTGAISSLAGLRLRGPKGPRDILVGADGRLFDAADGGVLASGLFDVLPNGGHESGVPQVQGSEVYWATANGQLRLHLWVDADDRVACSPIWQFRRRLHGGAAPVLSDGLLYVPRIADEFHPHNAIPWSQLDVYDAVAGHHYAKAKPVLDNALSPLPAVAGKDLVVHSDSGAGGMGILSPRPQLSFVAKGETPRVVCQAELPAGSRLHCPPLLDQERMILRLDREVICLGATTPEGRTYEEEQRALLVFARIGEHRTPPTVWAPPPLADLRVADDLPVCDLLPGLPPDRWLVAGPYPRGDTPGLPAALADPRTLPPRRGAPVPWVGGEASWADLDRAVTVPQGRAILIRGDQTIFRPGRVVDLLLLAQRIPDRTFFLATILRTEDPQILRFNLNALGAKAWICGREMKDDELVRFAPGAYPLVVRCDLGRIPPFGRALVNVSFSEIEDPVQVEAEWLGRIRRFKDQLAIIQARLPGRAARAQALLDALAAGRVE